MAAARLKKELVKETQYLNKVQMIPCERRGNGLAHHFDKRYQDKASRGWQPEAMGGRHHVVRMYNPETHGKGKSSQLLKTMLEPSLASSSLNRAGNLEELMVLRTAMTMELSIKSDVHNALGIQTNAVRVADGVVRMKALRVITRAFRNFRNRRWKRRFKDVDRKVLVTSARDAER